MRYLRYMVVGLLCMTASGWGFLRTVACAETLSPASTVTVIDALGRSVTIPQSVKHVLCSGSGCLRLLTYLKAQDRIVAVDDMEKRKTPVDPRPYALANPQFKDYPMFGEFRGQDNPELILALDPAPQVIFKTFIGMGTDPSELQQKIGIPVVALSYGNLGAYREDLYRSLRIMGSVLEKTDRAEAVIGYLNQLIVDLKNRTASVSREQKVSCYVGGIAFKGPHGFLSTEPTYPPFTLIQAENIAYDPDQTYSPQAYAQISKERLIASDPDVIFLDLSSLASSPGFSSLEELASDPAYRQLSAVRKGRVYGVMPYNSYAQNFGATLANAYFAGKILYPDRFSDIDPANQADQIFQFLVGAPVFDLMDASFGGRIFDPVKLPNQNDLKESHNP